MKKLFLLILIPITIFGCKKENNEAKPTSGKVTISCNAEYKLSTGEIKTQSAKAFFFIWEAKNKKFDNFPSDFDRGYAYDSISQKSYKNIFQGFGYIATTKLKPGRYFLFVILDNTPNDYDLPDMANSSVYFTISAGDKLDLEKTFGADTYSIETQKWNEK